MLKLSFYLAMIVPAVLSGLGEISRSWLILSVIAAWVWSIWLASGKGSRDYRKMHGTEFGAADNIVLKSALIRWMAIFAIYGTIRMLRG